MAPISSYTEKQIRDLIKTSESGMPYPDSTTQSTRNQTVDPTGDIHYIGRHIYAYSGTLTTTNTSKTGLLFRSDHKYIKGQFEFMGGVNYNAGNLNDGTIDAFRITLNDAVVGIIKIDMIQEDMPTKETFDIIIPPYSNVLVEVLGSANAVSELITITFTGEGFDA